MMQKFYAFNEVKVNLIPGGKVERNESKKDAIEREILEELKMQIDVKEEFLTVTHQYLDFIIIMYSFICSCQNPKLTLTEHIDYKWLKSNELEILDWAAADVPIVDDLLKPENNAVWTL